MTFIACVSGLEVQAVAEGDELRYSIDSRPANISILPGQGRQPSDCGAVGFDGLMANHAGRGSCNTHVLAGVGIRVTRLARDIRVCMRFVAERQGLRGWLRQRIFGANVESEKQ
jgi:hypothetical protein